LRLRRRQDGLDLHQQEACDKHLRSADFFDPETNGDITFQSTAIEQVDDETLRITGDLAINGITKSEVLHAELQGAEIDPRGKERVGFESTARSRAATTA
jgi:polyisoprenoid-binding protein YceI